jgi:uncharacterized membrane protein YphA (DoxX/SURF4 family)
MLGDSACGLDPLNCKWARFNRARDREDRPTLHRLFSVFPGGWPGIALLLVRAVLGFTLIVQTVFCTREPRGMPATWFVGMAASVAGALLLAGLLTPIVGVLVGLGAIGIGLSQFPTCTPNLFDSTMSITFTVTMLVAIIILGPGAFSVDAYLFGRRKIIISSPDRR